PGARARRARAQGSPHRARDQRLGAVPLALRQLPACRAASQDETMIELADVLARELSSAWRRAAVLERRVAELEAEARELRAEIRALLSVAGQALRPEER